MAWSICTALQRCCDSPSTAQYFAPWAGNPQLAAFADQLPPAHGFAGPAECASTLKQVLDASPLGEWVAQSKAGKVSADLAAAETCRSALDGAACGEPLQTALFDGRCFGAAPLPSQSAERRMFHRAGVPGDACAVIHDGPGAPLYGTCDATQAFCCYPSPNGPSQCSPPASDMATGTCVPAADMGQACQLSLPYEICKAGEICSTGKTCIHDDLVPLAAGDACLDPSLLFLGYCVNGYCDVLGGWTCLTKKADGSVCQGPAQCASASCVGSLCAASTFCVGN